MSGFDEGSMVNIDVGQIIAGKYELVKLLGKGAMGEVWLATHTSLGGEFAIKLVEPADDVEAETAAGRFQLEAQIAAKLSRRTRHIVSVSDHGEENGLAYLVMERLEGESLEQRVARTGPLELAEVAAIVSQVARALSLAHEEGIFHRDLKPANVWLGRDEDGRLLVKLLDFGIARSVKPFRTRSPFATSKDMVLGTPSYMSPEQARGLDTLDYRCDLWALAVGAYEALTRHIPFEGTTVEDVFLSICTFRVVPVRTRRPDLAPMVEAFFGRAFAPNIDERFVTAAELSEAFESLVDPDAFQAAIGIAPSSSRRLPTPVGLPRPAFGSAPELASASGLSVNLAPLPPASGPRLGSSPDIGASPPGGRPYGHSSSEFENVALHSPRNSQRPGKGGRVLIAAALLALLGVGLFGFVSYRQNSREMPTARPSEPPPTATSLVPTETAAPVTTSVEPLPVPQEPEPTAHSPTVTVRSKAPPAKAAPHASPPQPAAVVVAPPVVTTATASAPQAAPTPAPAKTVDKSGVL